MKHNRNWFSRAAAGFLIISTLAGVAIAVGQQGSQSDPLVTLSYLEQKLTPAILTQVDQKIEDQSAALEQQLQTISDGYEQEVRDQLGTGGTGASVTFQVVTMKAGQKLIGSAGCEFLLRSGTAVCVSDSAPGLVDLTEAGTLPSGSPLAANHLYLGTVDGRGVLAKTDVTILARGSVTLS